MCRCSGSPVLAGVAPSPGSQVWRVMLPAGSAAEAVNVTANDVSLSAGSVHLGQSAVEAVIKGNTFQALFNAHVHSTGVGPSGPPVVPLTGTELSLVSKTE